jgi:hypothetical protein
MEYSEIDQLAKQAGFLIGLSDELYMRDLNSSTAVMVERVDDLYDCYRLKWGDGVDGRRKLISEKYYLKGKGFTEAISKGKSLIDWYAKIGKLKETKNGQSTKKKRRKG